MGRRHQLFIIGKINGRYRQLCAIHAQVHYGEEALERCVDILQILEHNTNRLAIQQELIAAANKSDEFWPAPAPRCSTEYGSESSSEWSECGSEGIHECGIIISPVPFPFLTTCLNIGASFRPDGDYCGLRTSPFHGVFDEGDNDDGITIFDLTDLDSVRYCFVDFVEKYNWRHLKLMTPLPARTYWEAYQRLNGPDEKIPLLRKFHGRKLVAVGALKETWPHGDWQENVSIIGQEQYSLNESPEHAESNMTAAGNAGIAAEKQPTPRSENTVPARIKSLRDHSMDSLLDLLLHSTHRHSDLVAEAEAFPDFVAKLRRRLYDNAATLQPTTPNIDLLYKVLKDEVEIDISVFKKFAASDLPLLIAKLRGGNLRTLNLSNMPELTESDLQQILHIRQAPSGTAKPNDNTSVLATDSVKDCRAIILLETPKISLEFLTEHMGHCDIYHSALFRRPMYTGDQVRDPPVQNPLKALQFAATNTISQLVWVGTRSSQSCNSKLRLENGQFDWSTLKYSVGAYSFLSQDTDHLKYRNFLLDIPSPTAKIVHSFQRLTQYLSKVSYLEDWPAAAARCFATTSNLEDGGYSVGPMSASLYPRFYPMKPVESGKDRILMPGQWAIILVQEAFDDKNQKELDQRAFETSDDEEDKTCLAPEEELKFRPLKRLRYAFVKALSKSDPLKQHLWVTSVSGYVQNVLGGTTDDTEYVKKWWRKQRRYADYYKDTDMDAILGKIYASKELVVHQRVKGERPSNI
ncbi:MAG: hypothetical protein Q9210_004681 [Variospora velana]